MLLRFAAGIVVYVIIAAVVIACVAGTIFLWFVNPFQFEDMFLHADQSSTTPVKFKPMFAWCGRFI